MGEVILDELKWTSKWGGEVIVGNVKVAKKRVEDVIRERIMIVDRKNHIRLFPGKGFDILLD